MLSNFHALTFQLNSIVHAKASAVKRTRSEHMGPLLPFEELVNDASMDNSCKPEEECNDGEVKYCTLPDPRALLRVTSRKKAPVKKKSLPVVRRMPLSLFPVSYFPLFSC